MRIHSEVIELDPGTIDTTGPWLFRRGEPTQALLSGMGYAGQLHPVLVERAGSDYRLVSGTARLEAVRRLGRTVAARVVEAGEVDKGLLHLADYGVLIREQAELVRCCRYFKKRLGSRDIEQRVLPLLGLEPRKGIWRQVWEWCSLPESWDDPLFKGHLSLAAAELLVRFDPDDLGQLRVLFEELSWSRSNGQRLLEWLWAVCRRENRSVQEVLDRVKARELLAGGLSPKDVMEGLLTRLRRLRYPELWELERRFGNEASSLSRRSAWRLSPEQHFETGRVRLEAVVADEDGLAQALSDLVRLKDRPEWKRLWAMGGEEDLS